MVLKKLGDELTHEFHSVIHYLGHEQGMQVVIEPQEHQKLVSHWQFTCSMLLFWGMFVLHCTEQSLLMQRFYSACLTCITSGACQISTPCLIDCASHCLFL